MTGRNLGQCVRTNLTYIVSFILVIENSTQIIEINFLKPSRTARLLNVDHSLNKHIHRCHNVLFLQISPISIVPSISFTSSVFSKFHTQKHSPLVNAQHHSIICLLSAVLVFPCLWQINRFVTSRILKGLWVPPPPTRQCLEEDGAIKSGYRGRSVSMVCPLPPNPPANMNAL